MYVTEFSRPVFQMFENTLTRVNSVKSSLWLHKVKNQLGKLSRTQRQKNKCKSSGRFPESSWAHEHPGRRVRYDAR